MSATGKVCIIGAGCSGFTTAKALADRGIDFDCFEMSDQVGGNWAFKNKNGRSACYQSLHIDTSKYRMQFEDLPIPGDFPDYPHHAQVLAYFNAYVDRFGLRSKITFNTEVTRAERMADGKWRVTLSTGDVREYGALAVANGHHWDENVPAFAGRFDGVSFHSHKYLDPFAPFDMRGKRVLVVGMGNSAMDIASELSQKPIAQKLFVAARRGVWIFPKYINGQVPDKGVMPGWMPRWLMRAMVKRMIVKAVGHMKDYGLPEPAHHPADAHPSVSGEFLMRVGCGDIAVKPNIAELMGQRVRFEDGSAVRDAGCQPEIAQLDLMDEQAVSAFVTRMAAQFGGVHTAVYAAGPYINMRHISRLAPTLFRETVASDLFGCYHLVHAVVPELRKTRGALVALATPAIRRCAVKDVLSAAPKAAIEAVVKGLAAEEGRFGVRANCVGVGVISDGMYHQLLAKGDFDERFIESTKANVALRRLGSAVDVAEAVAFLASARAGYITGQTLMVDGGYAI